MKEVTIIKKEHSIELMRRISEISLSEEFVKDLKYPVYSTENHSWYLAYKEDKLIGFCSALIQNNTVVFKHDYVLKNERNNGVYSLLFKSRLNDFKGKKIKSTVTNKSVSTFIKHNFKIIKETKNYTFLEL